MSVWVESPINATFIHLEKTGGTSVERWLTENTVSYRVGKHSSYEKMTKWCNKNTKNVGVVFTIIRNPYERELSWYTYYLQKTKWRLGWSKQRDVFPESFSEKKLQTKYNIEKNQEIVNRYNGLDGFKKMIIESKTLSSQYYTTVKCDIVLRLENISKDFKQIKAMFDCNNNLEHFNKSKHNHYSYYYDDELREIVYNKHKVDFDHFGYKFD